MGNRGVLTKILAVIGMILLWAPLAFMILTSVIGSIMMGQFHCDFLIPAELFPIVIVGGLLLMWAALRAKLMRKPIIIDLIAAAVFLFAAQGIAILSGIASGAAAATGFYWWLIIATFVLHILSELGMAICGIMLIRKLRGK